MGKLGKFPRKRGLKMFYKNYYKVKALKGSLGSGKNLQHAIYILKAYFGIKWYFIPKKRKAELIKTVMGM